MRDQQGLPGRHGRRDFEEHRGHRPLDKEGKKACRDAHHHKKVQTFRRGRAVAFLEKLQVNRSTLQRQLQDPEFESIKQVISGELKATEMMMDEFIDMFQLYVTEGSIDKASEDDAKEGGRDQI